MRRATFLIILAGTLLGAGPAGRLDHPAIREASGIVRSRRFPDVFWVHNDSENAAALFAVRRDGSLIREYAVAMPNVDWEGIAVDDHGHIYIGEIGNNGGQLPLRAVYRLDEPDPSRDADKPLSVTLATFYRFPKGGRFDAEGLFLDGERPMIVSKRFDGGEAELFALPVDPPAPLLRPALPERIGALPGFVEPATGADLSADGRHLAVCWVRGVRVYRRGAAGWQLFATIRVDAGSIEAACWEGDDILLAGEDRALTRVAAAEWRVRAPLGR